MKTTSEKAFNVASFTAAWILTICACLYAVAETADRVLAFVARHAS